MEAAIGWARKVPAKVGSTLVVAKSSRENGEYTTRSRHKGGSELLATAAILSACWQPLFCFSPNG